MSFKVGLGLLCFNARLLGLLDITLDLLLSIFKAAQNLWPDHGGQNAKDQQEHHDRRDHGVHLSGRVFQNTGQRQVFGVMAVITMIVTVVTSGVGRLIREQQKGSKEHAVAP